MQPVRDAEGENLAGTLKGPVEAPHLWHHTLPGVSRHSLTRPALIELAAFLAELERLPPHVTQE